MSGIILGLREYIFLSLKELPLIASVAPLFLGISQGNVNLLMFGIGIAIIAPLAAALVGWLLSWPLNWLNPSGSLWKVPASDVSPLLSETPSVLGSTRGLVNVVPTWWMSMSVFFFAYLLFNAIGLYTQPPNKGADSAKVENRKAQAIMAILLIVILGLVICGTKIFLADGETIFGVITAIGTGSGAAWLWYHFLRRCGMGRLEDVFGIQARILPESVMIDLPVVCV